MKKIIFGQTNTEVSAMCLGTMLYGTTVEEKTAKTLLDHFTEAGGTFIDTANPYAFWIEGAKGGESEELLGRWMQEKKNRQDIFLATKIGANPADLKLIYDDNGDIIPEWYKYREGLSARAIEKAVEESLQRLKTDYIDLLYAHYDDYETPQEETMAAFDKLVTSGKVRNIGCSNFSFDRLKNSNEIARKNQYSTYCADQVLYSYLQPDPSAEFGMNCYADPELVDYCKENKDVALVAYSPLLSGKYVKPERNPYNAFDTPENKRRLKVLEAVAKEHDTNSLNPIVLAWLIQGTPRVIPVFSASKLVQLKDNLQALEIILSEDQLDKLGN